MLSHTEKSLLTWNTFAKLNEIWSSFTYKPFLIFKCSTAAIHLRSGLSKNLHVPVEKMNGKTLLQATQASEKAAAHCCALFQEPKKLDSFTKSSTGGSFALCSVFRCAVSRCAFLSVQVSDLTVTKDALINILREARQAIRCDSLFVSAHLRHSHINTVHFNPNKNNCTPFIPLLRFPLSAQ